MFLHLGSDVVIPLDSVIAITDYKTNKFVINRKFINHARENQKIIDISEGHPKSVVVTNSTFAAGNWEISLDVIGQGRHPVV